MTPLRSLHTKSEIFACVFRIRHPFQSKCMQKRRKSNLNRIFLWGTKVSEALCKRGWHNMRSYTFFFMCNIFWLIVNGLNYLCCQISVDSFVLVSSDNRDLTDPRGQRALFRYSPKLLLLYNMTSTSPSRERACLVPSPHGTPICSAERCPLTFDVRFMCLGILPTAV